MSSFRLMRCQARAIVVVVSIRREAGTGLDRPLTIAFWNVHNLFREGMHPQRGPKTARERRARLDALADVIGRLATGKPPDIIALAEVAEESLVDELVGRLTLPTKTPLRLFEPPIGANDTGIAMVGLSPNIATFTRVDAESRDNRPRALSVKVSLAASKLPPLYVIACHWKSNLHGRGVPGKDRGRSGKWLFDHLSGSVPAGPNGKLDPVVVLGDFNAEPYAPEISARSGLHATRHFNKSMRANGIRLFNCMWPWLVDHDHNHHAPTKTANQTCMPLTSYGKNEPQILDQVLVSRTILRGKPYRLGSVDYHCETNKTATRTPQLLDEVPYPWAWDDATEQGVGTSDHFPIVVSLQY